MLIDRTMTLLDLAPCASVRLFRAKKDEVLGDEVDASDSDDETPTCRLWDINFGWTPECAPGENDAMLCAMLNKGCCEPQSADNSSSCSTAKQTLHEPPFFGEHFLGLQGPGHWGAADAAAGAECSEGLLSTVGERIHLQRVGTSTFLNVQDTISHACQLHKFSPVLHPLLSELMMGNDSQHWWLLDSGAAATVMATASLVLQKLHWRLTECKGMCLMIHAAQFVREGSRHSNIVDDEKESLAVLRAEMNEGGADICFTEKGLADAVTYIALSHNHFSKAHGSDFSPLEYSIQRRLSKPSFAMFGQSVLADLPSSMRAQSPNETRSIEACFVHSGLDTGPVVQGAVRIDGELVLKRFVARNVKAITPIAWNQVIGDQLFVELEGGNPGQVQVPAQPMAIPAGVHVEPAAPDVNRPRLPAADTARPVEDDVVEYPDGAPGDLVREMKESDPTYRAPLPRKQAAEPAPPPRKPGELKIARQEPLRAPTPKSPAVVSIPSASPTSPASDVVRTEVRVFPKTPRCPACESGMNAPGIRHNADCKRKRATFEAENPPVIPPMPEVVHESRPRLEVRYEDMETEESPLRSAQVPVRLIRQWMFRDQVPRGRLKGQLRIWRL
eukprot:s393_g42.t1